MRTMPLRQVAALLLAATSVVLPQPADAALTRIYGPNGLLTDGKLFVKFDAAFDSANQVHLAVWGTQASGPTKGIFLNASGTAITGEFPISGGVEQAGWARVIYTPEQGKFLVSYTKILAPGVHQRLARFVTFQPPSSYVLSGEIIIDSWNGGAGGEPGMAYSRGRYLVTWWNWNSNPPQSYVAILDATGNVIVPKMTVSTAGDGQTDPEIACDPNRGRCLVIGHSWGVWSYPNTATWGQLISDDTGAPIGGGFYVSSGPLQKEPSLTFSAAGDQFIVAFSRNQNAVWATRVSAASPGPGVTYLVKSANESPEGAGYGRPRLAYNTTSQTSIVAMKPWIATTGVLELNAVGDVVPGTFQMTPQVTSWNEGTQEIAPAADPMNSRFLVADNQAFLTMRASVFAAQAGGGTPPPPPPPPPPVSVVAREKARADFNNDNWYDILWQNYATGDLALWNMAGTGIGQAQLLSAKLNDTNWRAVGTGDFNGDAAPDILWRHNFSGELVVWYMNNATVIGADYLSINIVGDLRWIIAGVGDLNGDNKPDIVWRHSDGWLAAWMMNGRTVVSSTLLSPDRVADPAWKIAAVSDFNDDGRMDLLWRHDNGWLAVWVMNGTTHSSTFSLSPATVDPAWKIVAVIDTNLDNKMDIIWQHANGWVAVWYMSGGSRIQTATLGPGQVADTNWKIAGPK